MEPSNSKELEIKQKKLGKGGLIALVTVLGMAAPLSTDMYMPSLPWETYIDGISVTLIICTMLTLVSWIIVLKTKTITMKGL